jgi:hypothetical protein
MKKKFGNKIFGIYGFTDAFNPLTDLQSPYILGIDQGISLLSIENHRTQNAWEWFMQNRSIKNAMNLVGFRPDVTQK